MAKYTRFDPRNKKSKKKRDFNKESRMHSADTKKKPKYDKLRYIDEFESTEEV